MPSVKSSLRRGLRALCHERAANRKLAIAISNEKKLIGSGRLRQGATCQTMDGLLTLAVWESIHETFHFSGYLSLIGLPDIDLPDTDGRVEPRTCIR